MRKKLILVGLLCLMLSGCGQAQEKIQNEIRMEKLQAEEAELTEEIELAEVATGRVIEGYTEEGTKLDSIYGQTEVLTYKFEMPEIIVENADAEEAVRNFIDCEKEIYEEEKNSYYWEADEGYRYAQAYIEEGMQESCPIYNYFVAYTVTQNDEQYISLRKQEYIYAGGAHGNTLYTGFVLDASSGALLELDDFLPGGENERVYLAQYLSEQLEENREALWEDYAEIIVYDICYNPDFYIENGNLVFPFDAYELGSYVAGVQLAQIPMANLSDLESAVINKEQVLSYIRRLKLPESINHYLVEIQEGETVYADLDGNGTEEEIWFQAGETEGDTFRLVINQLEFPIYVDENMIPEYMGLLDINAEDGQYELAFYANGPSDDPSTVFYRYIEDGIYKLGVAENLIDRNGSVFDGNYMLGDGRIYGKRRTNLPLETRWINECWVLVPEVDAIVYEARDYYAYGANPYGTRQAEFPYKLHDSLVVYEDASRDAGYKRIEGENNRITNFMGSDGKNWLQVELLTADGLMWGWVYVEEGNVEIQRDVYENAWKVIENLYAVG